MQRLHTRQVSLIALTLATTFVFGSLSAVAVEGPARAVVQARGAGDQASSRPELAAHRIVQDESVGSAGEMRADAAIAEYLEMHGRAESGLTGRAALMPWTSLRSAIN